MDHASVKKPPYRAGKTCSVIGCKNSGGFLKAWDTSVCDQHGPLLRADCPCLRPYALHCFPQGDKNEEKRRKWLANLQRKELNPTKNARVCSIHFIDGRPTEDNPYPTIHLGTGSVAPKNKGRKKPTRYPIASPATPATLQVKSNLSDCSNGCPSFAAATHDSVVSREDVDPQDDEPSNTLPRNAVDAPVNKTDASVTFPACQCICRCDVAKEDKAVQCKDEHAKDHLYGAASPVFPKGRTRATQTRLSFYDCIPPKRFRFFTGLSKPMFDEYVRVVSSMAKLSCKLDAQNQVLLTLMRLRLGLLVVDLAFRFEISVSLTSKVFHFWIEVLAGFSRDYLVMWLPQETILATRPAVFRDFPNTTCIADCFELFIDRAQNMLKRGCTFSPYKSHNTAKVLHVIAPNGFIMFISKAYGGRASDKFITLDSGLLKYLLPGDEILADKGFTIADILPYGVKLSLPSFRRKKQQLSEAEVVFSRRLSKV